MRAEDNIWDNKIQSRRIDQTRKRKPRVTEPDTDELAAIEWVEPTVSMKARSTGSPTTVMQI